MRTIRWLLVAPFAIAAWYVVFVVGVVTYTAVEEHLCPPDQFVSGACVNDRVMTILQVVVYAFIALSAVAVVIVAVSTAPAHRDIVAWGTFVFGAALAVLVGAEGRAYGEMATAIIAGLVTTVVAVRRASNARPSPPPPSP